MEPLTRLALNELATYDALEYNIKRASCRPDLLGLFVQLLPKELHEELLSRVIRRNLLSDDTIKLFVHPNLVSLKLSAATSFVSDATLDLIRSAGSNLRELSFYNCNNLSSSALSALFQDLHNLEMINFSKSPSFTADVMYAIEHYGKNIKSIILNRNPQVTDEVLNEGVFIRGGSRWNEISLLGCANITERVVYRLIYCRSLTKLNLSRCTNIKSSNALVDLIESCKNIVHLRLGNLKCVNNSVVQAIETSLAPRLISLDLSRTGAGSTLAFIRLLQHAPLLQELHVDNVEMEHLVALQTCLNIQQIHCQYLLPSILTAAADRQARLDLMKKFLTVCTRMRVISANKMDIPADLIHVILSNSPNLEELMVINSQRLNYQSISLESLPRLKHLELGSCADIDDKTMDSLSLSYPNLEYLNIGPSTGFTSLGASYLARITSLKELDLSYLTLDDDILPHLIKLRYLETLVLNSTKISMNTLLAVISHLPYLDTLNALSCENVSGLPLDSSRIIKAGCHSNLKRLDLSMSVNLSDEALLEILRLCHNLQTLDISGCRYISSTVVEQLFTLVPHVWELKIAKNDRISEEGFRTLVKLRNLISLNMSLCNNVTDDLVRFLLSNIPRLNIIHLMGCHITDSAVDMLLYHTSTPLHILAVMNTRVTRLTVEKIRARFPHLNVHFLSSNS